MSIHQAVSRYMLRHGSIGDRRAGGKLSDEAIDGVGVANLAVDADSGNHQVTALGCEHERCVVLRGEVVPHPARVEGVGTARIPHQALLRVAARQLRVESFFVLC
jgi:hypothetical protein